MTNPLSGDTTLREARDHMELHVAEGVNCPLCGQFAKIYRRKLNSSAVYSLIQMYRAHRTNWGHAPSTGSVARAGGELARCRHWGLIEEAGERRDDGGRAGWWRVTGRGELFIFNQLRVASHVLIFDNQMMRLDDAQLVNCQEALGRNFNYQELMQGL